MKKWKLNQINCFLFLVVLFFNIVFLYLPSAEAFTKLQERINLQDVAKIAKVLAEQSYKAPNKDNIPESLKTIAYDQWREIRYNPSKSLWNKDLFKVQFFHRGFIYPEQVTIHHVDSAGTHNMPFFSDLFIYAKNKYIDKSSGDIGFAGFRIHYPLNTPTYSDELISFLGASYFRALGKNLVYGISARGLAINTAEDIGEEFPYFKEFWIIRPMTSEKKITVLALMDSQSLTGAYEFIIRPGEVTVMHVNFIVFIRKPVRKLGIAPLSSMFCFGENSVVKNDSDFRPEVHDSDGLLIQNKSKEWTWHPVINPQRLLVNSFGGGQPLGFGLIQRDINFDHYKDLESRYDLRPSVWIEPEGDWGKGHLELLQIPSDTEYNDNISTFWVPEKAFKPGESVTCSYNLSWLSAKYLRSTVAIVESTRIVRKQNNIIFIVDFLPDLRQNLFSKKDFTADIQEFNGYKIIENQIIQNTVTKGLRLVVRIRIDKEGFLAGIIPKELPAVELRAFIKYQNVPVTETLSYTYLP